MKVELLAIDQLTPDPHQPRKSWPECEETELANSLALHGQIVPLIAVREGDVFLIMDGERRYRAAKRGKIEHLKTVVLDARPSEADLLLLQLTVNCMRMDLRPLERTEAYTRLMNLKSINATELAKLLGVSKGNVTRYLSHDKLPAELKEMLRDGRLSSVKAYALSRMCDEDRNEAIAELEEQSIKERPVGLASHPASKSKPPMRHTRVELSDCSLTLRASKAMDIESLLKAIAELQKACRHAKAQNLDLSTLAMVLRDRARSQRLEPAGVAVVKSEA